MPLMTHQSQATCLTPGVLVPRLGPLLACVLLLVLAFPALGLIIVGKGNDPVQDNNWPAGSLDLANLKTRVGWWEGPPFGGGQHQFLYRGDAKAFQEALDALAKIKAPALELYVHEGPHESTFLKDDDKDDDANTRVDWTFTVWNPKSWNHLYNNPDSHWNAEDPNFRKPVEAPRMDVYLDPAGAMAVKGVIDWRKVKVPRNVTVHGARASAAGFKGGSAVVGDVYDASTSKPIPGAKVTVARAVDNKGPAGWETVATADAGDDGHFEVTKVPAGNYRVVVEAPGYAARMLGYGGLGANTLKRYDARLSPAVSISGTVTDTDDLPATKVKVRVDALMGPDGRGYEQPDRAEATTDERGRFTIEGLPQGHCQLHTYGKSYHGVDVLKVYEIPAKDLGLRVVVTGTVKGVVTKVDGTPVQGNYIAQIEPEGGSKVGSWGGSSNVNADGTFRFDNVPPGTYVVSARPNPGPATSGKDPNARTIEVKPRQTAEVKFPQP